ncbi:MAG: oligopeptidase B [Acidimicrobiaceae bacterium]|nr:oligopeptidase B [Acidimicrobiaceae bacterium]
MVATLERRDTALPGRSLLRVNEPRAARRPHTWQRATGPVDDPYAWLRDRNDPATIEYLEAENAYADAWFGERQELLDALFDEIKSRVQETDESAPVRFGDWFYAARTVEGQSYPIHCRGRTAATASEQVLLDQNVEAEGHEFFDLGAFEVSLDHRRLAWSADVTGAEHYTLRIRDLATGDDLVDELHDSTWAGVAWSSETDYLFYVMPDEQERPYRVMRHRVGTPQQDDVEVYRDDDERFFVGIGGTRSGEWIVIQSGSKLSSESLLIPADDPTATPTVVRPRTTDVEYHVDHWGDRFVILTNDDAIDFRVMEAPLDAPAEWTELIGHEPGRRITGIEPFAGHLALHEWRHGQPQIRVVHRAGAQQVLAIDPEPHDVEFGPNEEWDTTVLRLTHQSMTTPGRVIDVDVTTGAVAVVKQTPTPNVDLDAYVSQRLWATAEDGTEVPVDIVRHVDTQLDGTAPCCVYAYGSYEASMPPWFSVARLSLLDRGVVFALAHPRGGGELGRNWYLDGKLLDKRNTFTDTLAVRDHLVETHVAAPDRLTVRGGSAGGLLVGACVTMRPDGFAAAVAEVPFVDVVSTMSDPSLPLTVTEWEEWGDPRAEPFASYIASYSPYDNTAPGAYPALYITAGLNDPRVSFHEPAKWTAKLREVRTNDAPLLLRTEMGAGHAGPSGRYEAWRDEARTLAFILTTTTP